MTAEEFNQTLLNTCEACRADERAKIGAELVAAIDERHYIENKLRAEIEQLRANRWTAFDSEEIDYLLGCIDATGDPYQYEIAHELGSEQERRQKNEHRQ